MSGGQFVGDLFRATRATLLAALLAVPAGGCQSAQKAFEQIELGKPVDPKVLPLLAKQTRNGVCCESVASWPLPVTGSIEALHVLKDDAGLVVAKGYYHLQGAHRVLGASVTRHYVLEALVPEDFREAAPEGWDGLALFRAAFPLNMSSVRKSLQWKLLVSSVGGKDQPEDDELKAPDQLPASYAQSHEQLRSQLEAAAAADKTQKTPRPGKDLPTRMMLTFMMLETLGADRPQRQARDISVAPIFGPPDEFLAELFHRSPSSRPATRPLPDAGELTCLKTFSNGRLRLDCTLTQRAIPGK